MNAKSGSSNLGPYRESVSMLRPFSVQSLRAVFFDFDRTLSDTRLDFPELRRRGLAALASFVPVSGDGSMPMMERMAEVLASLEPDVAAQAEAAALKAMEEVEVEAGRRSSLFPYAKDILLSLRERGIASAIVTRNCPQAVYAVFPDLDDYCACVLTRNHVKKVKPDPEHLGLALQRSSCLCGEALMVGDHAMDIEAGKRAGTHTAAVLTGEGSFAELMAVRPDVMAPDAGALMRGLGLL
ncbi:MAG: HAD family hydrolase [Desulfovibrio sp.]|nr:HAD family hydrolase [Desulfovibrio sp.]